MQRVKIKVERWRRFNADAAFEVFGDYGSGTIDYAHPMTPRPVALWPEAGTRAGHLLDGHLTPRHLDGVGSDGHLDGSHLTQEHLFPAMEMGFESPAYVFGRFQHAVRMDDGAQNASSAVVAAVTVNSAPSRPRCVSRGSYDGTTGRLTFNFSPSRFEPIRGS